jgi:hypothetical protein
LDDLKGLWKEVQEKNPPESFIRTTRKGHGKDAKGKTPQLGVSEWIRLRISGDGSARILSSNNPKESWKGCKGKKPLGWRFPKG